MQPQKSELLGRAAFAAVAVVAAALFTPAASVARGEPTPKATTIPSCEQLPGRTVALSSTWRVVRASHAKRSQLLACKLVPGPAREVVRIQPSSQYVSGVQLSGRVLALTEADQNGKYTPALSSTELIDLDRARMSRSPTFPFSTYSTPDESVSVRLLSGGSLLTWKNAGPTNLLDAAGTATVLPRAPSDAAVPPDPDGSQGPGAAAYVVPGDAEPVRVSSAGPLAIDWVKTKSVRRIANPLRVVRRPKELRTTLGVFDQSVVEMVETRLKGRPRASLELNGYPLGSIVPGTVARAVAASNFYAAADAVWADTNQRSTRFQYVGWGSPQRFAEVPTPDGGWTPGQIAVSSGGALAVAEPGRLRVWDPAERVIDAPGLTALAMGLNANYTRDATLFATDPQGVARAWKLPGREVPDPRGER